jgi:CheY-like chemotaxis protein
VLVIDDEADGQELLRLLLESSGIVVRTAEGAERGMADRVAACSPFGATRLIGV